MSEATAPALPMMPRRSKTILALLALFLGVLGAHWWYLRRPYAWLVSAMAVACALAALQFPVWFDNPVFFLLFIPMIDGFIEAAVFALMPDEKFDRRYNPQHPGTTRTSVRHVLIALASVLIGGVVGMFGLAMLVVHVYERMGWLDGLTY